MEQQWSQTVNESPPALIPNISTEQIQKCLEENTQLIQFILETKRLGRHKECEMYTAKLQHNLTFLSNLADVMAQPSPPPPPPKPVPPQVMAVGPTRQQGHWSVAPRQSQLNDEENRIQQQQQGYYLPQQQQFMGFGRVDNNINNNNNNNNNNNSYMFDHQDSGGASDSTVATNFLGI